MDVNAPDPPRDGRRHVTDHEPGDDEVRDTARDARRRRLGFIIGGIVLCVLVIGGFIYWLHARHYESTDDAFVDGNTTKMSAQVAGRVTALLFKITSMRPSARNWC